MRTPPACRRLAIAAASLALLGCEPGTTGPSAEVVRLAHFAGDDQEGLPGQPLRTQLAVRAVDAEGRPVPRRQVRFVAAAGSGTVENPSFLTTPEGIAATGWTLGSSEIAGQSVRAELLDESGAPVGEPVVFRARRLLPERADLFLAENTPGGSVRLVAFRRGAFTEESAYRAELADSLPILPFAEPAAYDEIFALAPDRPAVLVAPVTWTAGRDTVRLRFPEPARIQLTIWVVKGPFDERAQVVEEHLRNAEVVWKREGLGILFGETEIVDATAHPRAGEFQGTGLQPCGIPLQSAIGERTGRINVYYVGGIAGFSAYACNTRLIVMGDDSGLYGNLLAHELGHTFGLQHHAFGTENLMNPFPGGALTDGQVYHALFGAGSSLNTVYGLRPPAERRECGSAVVGGVFRPAGECVPILLQIDR